VQYPIHRGSATALNEVISIELAQLLAGHHAGVKHDSRGILRNLPLGFSACPRIGSKLSLLSVSVFRNPTIIDDSASLCVASCVHPTSIIAANLLLQKRRQKHWIDLSLDIGTPAHVDRTPADSVFALYRTAAKATPEA
jgi:hypothetical protein